MPLPPFFVWQDSVVMALKEDLGRRGDLTTRLLFPPETRCEASFVPRTSGIVCGIEVIRQVFHLIDPSLVFQARKADGDSVGAGETIASVSGSAIGILEGERTALNFLTRLCGIATATRSYADLAQGTKARICCTRKTTPGLRVFEKYAVTCGGGVNHRFGLDDAILIKDNHIAVAGGVSAAIMGIKKNLGHMVKIEVEVDTSAQLEEALNHDIDAVLLDNWPLADLGDTVRMIGGRVVVEASGNMTAEKIPAVARSGVDLISSGWLTNSAPGLDVGLDIT